MKQHCFPRRSIERFANDEGVVNVRLIEQRKSVLLAPEDQVFCAHWVWDQRAEVGFMREVEDPFQALADDIEGGRIVRRLRAEEDRIVTEMFALWLVRSERRDRPVPDQRLEVIGVAHDYSQDDRERLEKAGIGSVRPDLTMDGRHIAGGAMQSDFFRLRKELEGQRWALLATRDIEFPVPDVPVGLFLPVTPKLCLVPGRGYRMGRASEVANLNARAVAHSRRYFFARSPVGAIGIEKARGGGSASTEREGAGR